MSTNPASPFKRQVPARPISPPGANGLDTNPPPVLVSASEPSKGAAPGPTPAPLTGQREGDKYLRSVCDNSGIDPADLGPGTSYVVGTTDRTRWPLVEFKDDDMDDKKKVPLNTLMYGYIRFPAMGIDGKPRQNAVGNPIYKLIPHFHASVPQGIRDEFKYISPSREVVKQLGYKSGNLIWFPPGWLKNFNPKAPRLFIIEGDKKGAKGVRAGLPGAVVVIPGCSSYGDGNEPPDLNPDILEAIQMLKTMMVEADPALADCAHAWGPPLDVTVIPDGDYRKPQIGGAYERMVRMLEKRNSRVDLWDLNVFAADYGADKFDDVMIALEKDGGDINTFMSKVRVVSALDLPDDPYVLRQELGLIPHRTGAKAGLPLANIDNAIICLENHRRFLDPETKQPIFGFNLDTGKAAMDGKARESEDMLTEVRRVFIRQLQFNDTREMSSSDMKAALNKVSLANSFSPLRDDLLAYGKAVKDVPLPTLVKELQTWTVDLLEAPADVAYIEDWSLKFLVTGVALILDPGTFIKTLFATCGPGGLGKTHVPGCFFGHSNVAMLTKRNTAGKDLDILISSKTIANAEEGLLFKGMSTEEYNELISRTQVQIRLPFGTGFTETPRRFMWYASFNRADSLPPESTGRSAVLDLRTTHVTGQKFPLVKMSYGDRRSAETIAAWEARRTRLLGAAVAVYLAVKEGRYDMDLAQVEGVFKLGDDFQQKGPLYDTVADTLESDLFRGSKFVRVGDRFGVETVALKATDFYTFWGREGAVVKGDPVVQALGAHGFEKLPPDTDFTFTDGEGVTQKARRVYVMPLEEFVEKFGPVGGKF